MQQVRDPVEAGRLLHRRDELVRQQEKLIERVAWFENPVNGRKLNELNIEISVVLQKLDELGIRRSDDR
jgi:hypothetical protein